MGLNLSNSHENEGAGQDFREYGGWGARENFLRFYKMPFKYKLTGGGGGGKIVLICDERKHGGVLPKQEVERNQRPK